MAKRIWGIPLTSIRCAAVVLFFAATGSALAAAPISGAARKEAEALYQSAYAAYTSSDYPRALALLDSAEALRPDYADCLNLQGIICLRQSNFDKAEAAFARAVALDSTLWAAQFNLGEIPFRKHDFGAARERFEKLLSHTSRFKDKNQWELVQYKAFLCALLTGDEAGAQKKVARLPVNGGVTPAYQYAQAAVCLSKKDGAGANKWLTAAQANYSPSLNSMFADSLVTAGWAPALPAGAALALARQSQSAMNIQRDRPASAYLDTRLEAAAAEPLPQADGGILPMLPPTPGAVEGRSRSACCPTRRRRCLCNRWTCHQRLHPSRSSAQAWTAAACCCWIDLSGRRSACPAIWSQTRWNSFQILGMTPQAARFTLRVPMTSSSRYRTHDCAQLRPADAGRSATLAGWVASRRDHGGVIFIDLRDREGVTQVVFRPEEHPAVAEAAHGLRSEDVISVHGKVAPRLEGKENPELATGEHRTRRRDPHGSQ